MLEAAAPLAPPHKLANAAALVTILSVLSPTAGLFLEISLAWKFGAAGLVDAFRTAYLLIVFGSQLFMSLLLPHIVVPLIAGYRARGEEEAGWRLAVSFGQVVTAAGLLFAAWVAVWPAPIGKLLAPGLAGASLGQSLVLLRFFAAAFAAVLACGVITGILYVHHVFALPLISQMICNVSIALGVLLFGRHGTLGIAAGCCIGFSIMLALHGYALIGVARGCGIRLRRVFRPAPARDVAAVFTRSMPLLILAFTGIATAAMANSAVSRLSAGSLALYGYASKLVVIVLFASGALATVMFPVLSDAAARRDLVQFSQTSARAIRMVLLLTVPLAAVTYVLREPLVHAAFGRGAISAADLSLVTHLFAILLCHAPASALGVLLLKIYFALGDTRTLAGTHLLLPAVLYALIPVGVDFYGGPGILIAFDVVAWLAPMFLLAYGIARYRIFAWSALGRFGIKLAAISGVVGTVAVVVDWGFRHLGPRQMLLDLMDLAVAGGGALLAGWLVSRRLGMEEAGEMERFVAWRFGFRTAP